MLLLGGGAEGLVAEVLQHRPAQVDLVELDEAALRLSAARLGPALEGSLRAGGVSVSFADPRRFLRTAGRYDLVLLAMPEPDSAQANRFYTRELFQACAAHLGPGGVLAFRLRASENLWPQPLVRRTASIDRALRDVFADVLFLPGGTNLVLASASPLLRDPAALAGRFHDRALQTRLVSPAWLRDLLMNDRTPEIARLLARTSAPANTDARPVCYPYTLVLWLAMFFPSLALRELPALSLPAGHAGIAVSALGLAALLCAGRRLLRPRPAARRAFLVFLAGFSGMVLELALVLHYQSQSGALYQDLGLLLTMFMGGLSLGALAPGLFSSRANARSRGAGAGLLCAQAALALLLCWLLPAGRGGGLLDTSLLLLLAGALPGALFAWASRQGEPDQRDVISPLYAADLIGGCLGSLTGSLLLIPMAGLAGTALVVAAAAAAALVVL